MSIHEETPEQIEDTLEWLNLSSEQGISCDPLEELVDVAVEQSVWASLLTQDKCLEDEGQKDDTNYYRKMTNEGYSSHN